MSIETVVECDRCHREVYAGSTFYFAEVTGYCVHPLNGKHIVKTGDCYTVCPECWKEIGALWRKGEVE